MEKAMIPGALAEALQKRREIMVVTVSPRGLLPKCQSRPVLRHEFACWRQRTPIADALAAIGDRSENTQNKADMRPVTCAIGMAAGPPESANGSLRWNGPRRAA